MSSNEQYEPWVPAGAFQRSNQPPCNANFLSCSMIESRGGEPDDTLEQLASSLVDDDEARSPLPPNSSTPERLLVAQRPDTGLSCGSNSSRPSTAGSIGAPNASRGVETAAGMSASPPPPNPFLDLQLEQLEEEQQPQQQCEVAALQQQQQEQEALLQRLQQVQPASRKPWNLQVVLPESTICNVMEEAGPADAEQQEQQQLQASWSFDLDPNLQRTASVPAVASPNYFGSKGAGSNLKNSGYPYDQEQLQLSNSVPAEISSGGGEGARRRQGNLHRGAFAARPAALGVASPCPPGEPKLGLAAKSPRFRQPAPVRTGGLGGGAAAIGGGAAPGAAASTQQQQGLAGSSTPRAAGLVPAAEFAGWFQQGGTGLGNCSGEQLGDAARCQREQPQAQEVKQDQGVGVSRHRRAPVFRDITFLLHEAAEAEEKDAGSTKPAKVEGAADVNVLVDQDAARGSSRWVHGNLPWPEARSKQVGRDEDLLRGVELSSGSGLSFRHFAGARRCGKCEVWVEPCGACAESSVGQSPISPCSAVNTPDSVSQDLPPLPPHAHLRGSVHGQQLQRTQPRRRSMDEEEDSAVLGSEHGWAAVGAGGTQAAASPRAMLRPLHAFGADHQLLPPLSGGDMLMEADQQHQQHFYPHPPHAPRSSTKSPAPPPVPPSPQQRQAAHARQRSVNNFSSPCASPVTHSLHRQASLNHQQQQHQPVQGGLQSPLRASGPYLRQELSSGLLGSGVVAPAFTNPAQLRVPETPRQHWPLEGGDEAPNSGSSSASAAPSYDPATLAAICSHLKPRAGTDQQQQGRQQGLQPSSARSSGMVESGATTDLSPASSSWSGCSGLSVSGPLGPSASVSGAFRARASGGDVLAAASPSCRNSHFGSRLSSQLQQLEQTRSIGSLSSIGAWPSTPAPTPRSGLSTPAGTPRATAMPHVPLAEPLPPKADRPIGRSPAAVNRVLTPATGVHSPRVPMIGSPNLHYLQMQHQQCSAGGLAGAASPMGNLLVSPPGCSSNLGPGVAGASISNASGTSTPLSSGRGSGSGHRQIPLWIPPPAFIGGYGLPAVHENLPLSPNVPADGVDDATEHTRLPTLGHSPVAKIETPQQPGVGAGAPSLVSNAANLCSMLPVGGRSIMADLLVRSSGEEMVLSVGSSRPKSPLGPSMRPMVQIGCNLPQLGLQMQQQQQQTSGNTHSWLIQPDQQQQQQGRDVQLPSSLLDYAFASSTPSPTGQVPKPLSSGFSARPSVPASPPGDRAPPSPWSPCAMHRTRRMSAPPVYSSFAAAELSAAAHAFAEGMFWSHGLLEPPPLARAQSHAAASIVSEGGAGVLPSSMGMLGNNDGMELGLLDVARAAAAYRVPSLVQQQQRGQQHQQQYQGVKEVQQQTSTGKLIRVAVAEDHGVAGGKSGSKCKSGGMDAVKESASGVAAGIGKWSWYWGCSRTVPVPVVSSNGGVIFCKRHGPDSLWV